MQFSSAGVSCGASDMGFVNRIYFVASLFFCVLWKLGDVGFRVVDFSLHFY